MIIETSKTSTLPSPKSTLFPQLLQQAGIPMYK